MIFIVILFVIVLTAFSAGSYPTAFFTSLSLPIALLASMIALTVVQQPPIRLGKPAVPFPGVASFGFENSTLIPILNFKLYL